MNLKEIESIRQNLVAETENGNVFQIWEVLDEWGRALKQFRKELEGEKTPGIHPSDPNNIGIIELAGWNGAIDRVLGIHEGQDTPTPEGG